MFAFVCHFGEMIVLIAARGAEAAAKKCWQTKTLEENIKWNRRRDARSCAFGRAPLSRSEAAHENVVKWLCAAREIYRLEN